MSARQAGESRDAWLRERVERLAADLGLPGRPPRPPGPRRNRVDPWGGLHAVPARGTLTGNRGCLVDAGGQVTRHHRSQAWITCVTEYGDRRQPLDDPRRWTPLFFLDEAVALAAGHRPCAACRRPAYDAYREAVTWSLGAEAPLRAPRLDARLREERRSLQRGLHPTTDRILWSEQWDRLPAGTVVVADDTVPGPGELVTADRLLRFSHAGWVPSRPRPTAGSARVLTPPTSVAAMRYGYVPALHPSASD